MFYSSVNNKWKENFFVQILSNRRIFLIRRKFRGRGSCPYWLTTCHDASMVVEGYVLTLLPETPGTRVPVQIPDGYPGTKIPESPSTNRVHHCKRSLSGCEGSVLACGLIGCGFESLLELTFFNTFSKFNTK